jgi:hypothetical protein
MAIKGLLSWVNPVTRADGTAYNQTQNAGYEIQFDGTPAVSIPLSYGTSFDMTTLAAYNALIPGTHTVGIAVVDTGGLVSSFATTSFPAFSKSLPLAPTSAAVS